MTLPVASCGESVDLNFDRQSAVISVPFENTGLSRCGLGSPVSGPYFQPLIRKLIAAGPM